LVSARAWVFFSLFFNCSIYLSEIQIHIDIDIASGSSSPDWRDLCSEEEKNLLDAIAFCPLVLPLRICLLSDRFPQVHTLRSPELLTQQNLELGTFFGPRQECYRSQPSVRHVRSRGIPRIAAAREFAEQRSHNRERACILYYKYNQSITHPSAQT